MWEASVRFQSGRSFEKRGGTVKDERKKDSEFWISTNQGIACLVIGQLALVYALFELFLR